MRQLRGARPKVTLLQPDLTWQASGILLLILLGWLIYGMDCE